MSCCLPDLDQPLSFVGLSCESGRSPSAEEGTGTPQAQETWVLWLHRQPQGAAPWPPAVVVVSPCPPQPTGEEASGSVQAQLRGEHIPKGDGCNHLAQDKKAQLRAEGLGCGRDPRDKGPVNFAY